MWYSVVWCVTCCDIVCCVVLYCIVFKEGDTIYVMWCSMVLRGVYVYDFSNDVDLCGVL